MNRCWSSAVVMVLALLAVPVTSADEKTKLRNPFNVKDVPDPDGSDVKAFAAKVELPGDAKDANAAQWAEKATPGKLASLDGVWYSRWSGGTAGKEWGAGTAKVKAVGDRVYILYEDRTGTYLIDAQREGARRLVGRYMYLRGGGGNPWVGVVVDDERIDGEWTMGRWDLRRKIADN